MYIRLQIYIYIYIYLINLYILISDYIIITNTIHVIFEWLCLHSFHYLSPSSNALHEMSQTLFSFHKLHELLKKIWNGYLSEAIQGGWLSNSGTTMDIHGMFRPSATTSEKQHRNPWFQQCSYIISVFLLFFKGEFIVNNISFLHCFFTDFLPPPRFVRGATSRAANFTLEDFNDFCCSFTAKRDATIMIGKLNLPGVQQKTAQAKQASTFHWNPMGKTKRKKIQEAETHNESQTPPSNDSNSKLWMV